MKPMLLVAIAVFAASAFAAAVLLDRARRRGPLSPEDQARARTILIVSAIGAAFLVLVAILMPHGAAR